MGLGYCSKVVSTVYASPDLQQTYNKLFYLSTDGQVLQSRWYNKVQARDDSVQQYIIHKVPRAHHTYKGEHEAQPKMRLEVK